MTLFKHEMKMNLKSLLIWTACVGGLCLGCILLYTSLEESLQDMAEAYQNMGAMSQALGMDKISLATLEGFYATEIGMIFGLGGAMFAAITGSNMVSKEEKEHTSEFLNVFPLKRSEILTQKYIALLCNILIFNLVSVGMCLLGFVAMKEDIPGREMVLYHGTLLFMQIELGTICFAMSAQTKRNLMGAGLGLVILAFAADMMCRIIPAIENLKYVTPFSYAYAADIFTTGRVDGIKLAIGAGITCIALILAWSRYCRRDLAS